jgi:hypothetical protein
MMKKHFTLLLLFARSAVSFVVPLQDKRVLLQTFLSEKADSDAEAHMQEMPKVWEELKKTERDILVQQQLEGSDETEATEKLVENMLETALDFIKTKELVETERAKTAHENFQWAMREEEALEDFLQEEYKSGLFIDGSESLEEHAHKAHDTEISAIREEAEALHDLADLYEKEEAVKATLEELKRLSEEDSYTSE